jgi:hypothetical protein
MEWNAMQFKAYLIGPEQHPKLDEWIGLTDHSQEVRMHGIIRSAKSDQAQFCRSGLLGDGMAVILRHCTQCLQGVIAIV